jgi:hypothetical protein
MALVNFTNLDFDQIKASIRDYLRANSNFTDFDYEGSNISTLIDVLAYNTYISSYNANMASNEVFIDSATLRENVVSLARNIGYTPRSRRGARSIFTFFVDVTNLAAKSVQLTLKSGVVATSQSFGAQSYTFTIPADITVPVVNNVAYFRDVECYEGTYLSAQFTVSATDKKQRFILDNPNIDTSTIKVTVDEDGVGVLQAVNYTFASNLFTINSSSRVFFIQEIEDERYEILFGDGVFGKKLEAGATISIYYNVTNGEEANGITSLSFSGRILDNNSNIITSDISLITVTQPSTGGAAIESISSIKKYAPKLYAAKNRAVTTSDYEAIIPQIYPEAESVSVFGGEELDPPRFGKVYITIKPSFGPFVPNSIKDNLKKELRKYSVAGIVPEILDLKYLYIELDSSVYYNPNLASSSNYVLAVVKENLDLYANSTEMNKYGARFKYSKVGSLIDNSHEAITSNITEVEMRRDASIKLNEFAEYEICFGNAMNVANQKGYNIRSSGFIVSGIQDTVYLTDIPNSDNITGNIIFFRLLSDTQVQIVRKSAGVIFYKKGEILLNPVKIINTTIFRSSNVIEISVSPKSNDVIGLQDLYLQLDISRTSVDMVIDDVSSGSFPSGTNYVVTPSYSTKGLVRK